MIIDKQLEERIRERAYEIWLQHGCQPDRSEEDWFEAEREVRASSGLAGADPAGIDPDGSGLLVAPGLMSAEGKPDGSGPAVKMRRRRLDAAMADRVGAEAMAASPRKRRSAKTL